MSDWPFLNRHRLRRGDLASDDSIGFNGAFSFAVPGEARRVFCIASDGLGWQHVSVSFGPNRATPSWAVMCHCKELFWEPEDVVIQLHPPKSRWISNHDGCLHLWRCTDGREQALPLDVMVGVRGVPDPKAQKVMRDPGTNDVRERMQEAAQFLSVLLPAGTGFVLLAFDFGDALSRRLEYVSNAQRHDVVAGMLEFIRKTRDHYGKDTE